MDNKDQEELLQRADIHQIAEKGQEIYERLKSQYEPAYNDKFLAIETESEKVFLADTGVEAMQRAKREFPEKIFYVVKIGHRSTEIMSRVIHHR